MMRIKWLIPFLFLMILVSLHAFEWPVGDVVMKKTFGEMSGAEFNTGITLGGERQAVSPVDFGEVVYYEEVEGAIPSGLGSFVVIGHARSLYSIYSHLEPGFLSEWDGYAVNPDQAFGWVGRSGDAPGRQLNLEIVDLEFDQMVNPLNLLPPLEDNSEPVVEGLWMNGEEWTLLEDGGLIKPGSRELFISVYDQSVDLPYYRPMAPFKLNVFANGEEVFYQIFEAIESRNGELHLISKQESRSFANLYNDEGYIRIGDYTFNPGETILEVIAADYRGNKNYYSIRIRVSSGD